MKTYQAEYSDKTGRVIARVSFEANDLTEAREMAQAYKSKSEVIQNAGKVKTYVGCIDALIKKAERGIRFAERLKRERDEYLKSLSMDNTQ